MISNTCKCIYIYATILYVFMYVHAHTHTHGSANNCGDEPLASSDALARNVRHHECSSKNEMNLRNRQCIIQLN